MKSEHCTRGDESKLIARLQEEYTFFLVDPEHVGVDAPFQLPYEVVKRILDTTGGEDDARTLLDFVSDNIGTLLKGDPDLSSVEEKRTAIRDVIIPEVVDYVASAGCVDETVLYREFVGNF